LLNLAFVLSFYNHLKGIYVIFQLCNNGGLIWPESVIYVERKLNTGIISAIQNNIPDEHGYQIFKKQPLPLMATQRHLIFVPDVFALNVN